MQYIINTYKELPMQIINRNANTTKCTFEGTPVSAEGRDKIMRHLDHIIHIIGYPKATNDDILTGVNGLLQTIVEYGYGDAVSDAIKHIITATNGDNRRGRDTSFMIDAVIHTLILSPANGIGYQVINFDVSETGPSGVAEHYNNPLVSKLLESIADLPKNTTMAIISGLGDFLDNVYVNYKYHSTDIPMSGNIIMHVNYDSLSDDTTSIMVYNKEMSIDLKQITKRIRQHDIRRYGGMSINEYIHVMAITKPR